MTGDVSDLNMKNGIITKLRSLVRRTRQPRNREEFGQLFRSFRELMDSNTRALEIITEMGEILGGDYLFDIQYVRRTLDELDARVASSLRHFDELSGEEHRELNEIYRGINGAVRQVLDGAAPETGELVLPLGKIDGSMAASVGGKMANLGEAKRSLPLLVPDGFVVTTRGFDAYVRHNRVFEKAGLRKDWRSASPSWYDGLAEMMLHGELPAELHQALARALGKLRSRCGNGCMLAVRSSAGDEDGVHSFAGQFATVLGVPPDTDALEKAYRKVTASLFSGPAAAYQERFGYDPRAMKMAVGFVVMVDAVASGVLFTADPAGGRDVMVISSAWGLGTSVVDGKVDADQFVAGRDGAVVEERIGSKAAMSAQRPGGGVRETETPGELRVEPSISRTQINELVRAGGLLEKHFRGPQDVEWAFDAEGRLFILQSRPLRVAAGAGAASIRTDDSSSPFSFRSAGIVVQRGVAAGVVHVIKTDRDLETVPRGAVLAVKHDSPSLVRVMPRIAAIITDTGSLTSHMASLAREFRVPTLVNTGNATKLLPAGREVTVLLGEEVAVLMGRDASALASGQEQAAQMDDLYEFRRKRYILRLVAPLNLVDPFRDDFSPRACRTVHDVLRFLHERAVARLIEAAGFGARSGGAVKLDLPIPAGITVIDIGGGLEALQGEHAALGQITSVPFRAIAEGMVHPGAWRSEAVPLSMNNFLASMVHAPDLVAESDRQMGANVAVISGEYVNLNIKFGYHYTVIDSYVSDTPRSNHIYFRFAGGATDLNKRSRRLRLIERILTEHGFGITTRGDLLIGRLSGLGRQETVAVLDQVGRLLSFTRQMDALLQDDNAVERYAQYFFTGAYDITALQGK